MQPRLLGDRASPTRTARAARAEQLVLLGQLSRGAAALDGEVEPERAFADAQEQLVTGLSPQPVLEPPAPEPAQTVIPPEEKKEWVAALLAAARSFKPRSAPGPSGLTGDLLQAMLAEDAGLVVGVLAELIPHILVAPPAALSCSRLAVIVKHKPDGRRKARAVACGECVMRLIERAVVQRWGARLRESARHSTAHMRDGALRTAVVMQNIIAHGQPMASLDAKRAFDAVAHTAVRAALGATVWRATAQGTALGPYLFSIVCERAARAAAGAGAGVRVVQYLDNLYISAPDAATLAGVTGPPPPAPRALRGLSSWCCWASSAAELLRWMARSSPKELSPTRRSSWSLVYPPSRCWNRQHRSLLRR